MVRSKKKHIAKRVPRRKQSATNNGVVTAAVWAQLNHLFDEKNGVQRKKFRSKPISIGKNCWIGANTVILKGTVIGDNCVIGAGSVISGVYGSGLVIVQKRIEERMKRQ